MVKISVASGTSLNRQKKKQQKFSEKAIIFSCQNIKGEKGISKCLDTQGYLFMEPNEQN